MTARMKAPRPVAPTLASVHVVVVDDERRMVELVTSYLEELGIRTTGCHDGQRGAGGRAGRRRRRGGARPDAPGHQRARRVPPAAPRGQRRADPDAHRPRRRPRAGGRPGGRRRRLPGQAVRARGAGRPAPGDPAPPRATPTTGWSPATSCSTRSSSGSGSPGSRSPLSRREFAMLQRADGERRPRGLARSGSSTRSGTARSTSAATPSTCTCPGCGPGSRARPRCRVTRCAGSATGWRPSRGEALAAAGRRPADRHPAGRRGRGRDDGGAGARRGLRLLAGVLRPRPPARPGPRRLPAGGRARGPHRPGRRPRTPPARPSRCTTDRVGSSPATGTSRRCSTPSELADARQGETRFDVGRFLPPSDRAYRVEAHTVSSPEGDRVRGVRDQPAQARRGAARAAAPARRSPT